MKAAELPHPEMLQMESERLERLPAAARVRWAVEVFGEKLILSTSFGIQSAVMLHLVTQVVPSISVGCDLLGGPLTRPLYILAARISIGFAVGR
jgi:3'-phosphoadenosine 5'-phosphosulfate sulfotransferase (PAPS reductase)/FAD synthetase